MISGEGERREKQLRGQEKLTELLVVEDVVAVKRIHFKQFDHFE